MTAPAIPEHLDEFVYDLMLRRKSCQAIADQLWERHQVRASRMAVASCLARVKAEKRRQLFELTEGGVEGGIETLDRLFRESQAFAIEAVEGRQLHAGMRAIDQQLRILKFYRAELQARAAAEREALRPDTAMTLLSRGKPRENQGDSATLQGVEMHPAADSRAPASQPGLNQPCPCGSHRKYKKCCLLRAPTEKGGP